MARSCIYFPTNFSAQLVSTGSWSWSKCEDSFLYCYWRASSLRIQTQTIKSWTFFFVRCYTVLSSVV